MQHAEQGPNTLQRGLTAGLVLPFTLQQKKREQKFAGRSLSTHEEVKINIGPRMWKQWRFCMGDFYKLGRQNIHWMGSFTPWGAFDTAAVLWKHRVTWRNNKNVGFIILVLLCSEENYRACILSVKQWHGDDNEGVDLSVDVNHSPRVDANNRDRRSSARMGPTAGKGSICFPPFHLSAQWMIVYIRTYTNSV